VNLPKHLSEPDDTQEHEESNSVEFRTREATQLLTYLWDNYIELNESTHIFLVGTNIGHGAIINFIKDHEDQAQEQLTAAISFVEDVPLQSCKSPHNESLAHWYHDSSLIFVTPEHNFWCSELSRKPKKRFGKVIQSPKQTITDMLIEHKDDVFELILRETTEWRSRRKRKGQIKSMEATSPIGPLISSKGSLPPISNFALPKSTTPPVRSPGLHPGDALHAPRGSGAGTPNITSPPRSPFNNAIMPQQRASQSPARR
jgi:histone deacetylase 6